MPKQQYKNHIRYYIPHHFIFYPLIFFILAIAVKNVFANRQNNTDWLIISILICMLGWLSFMMRQHYALTNQNRIVRLEMRLRYYQLTQQRFEALENKLSFKQIAALRFAGDNELLILINKTIKENLQPNAVKKLITDWQADTMRV
jgi:Family of unknown function (DUF6526)